MIEKKKRNLPGVGETLEVIVTWVADPNSVTVPVETTNTTVGNTINRNLQVGISYYRIQNWEIEKVLYLPVCTEKVPEPCEVEADEIVGR